MSFSYTINVSDVQSTHHLLYQAIFHATSLNVTQHLLIIRYWPNNQNNLYKCVGIFLILEKLDIIQSLDQIVYHSVFFRETEPVGYIEINRKWFIVGISSLGYGGLEVPQSSFHLQAGEPGLVQLMVELRVCRPENQGASSVTLLCVWIKSFRARSSGGLHKGKRIWIF